VSRNAGPVAANGDGTYSIHLDASTRETLTGFLDQSAQLGAAQPDDSRLRRLHPDAYHLDPDKDSVPLPDDKCPDALETKNGFQDDDGCPDELPATVAKFTGAIGGINFAPGKATLTKDSSKALDGAVTVLTEFPALRLEIVGHTDDAGARETNVKLSGERAEAVKAYLTGKGIEAARLTTRGAGPDEPVADNKTKAGQAKNRRIEFKLLP